MPWFHPQLMRGPRPRGTSFSGGPGSSSGGQAFSTTTFSQLFFGSASLSAMLFSRTTLGYVHDSSGQLYYPAHNIWLHSEDATQWASDGAGTISANAATAPFGGVTADKFQYASGNSRSYRYQVVGPMNHGKIWTTSIYAKKAEKTWMSIGMNDAAGNFFSAWFNLSAGSVGTVQGGASVVSSATISALGDNWYRCAMSLLSGSNPNDNTYLPTINVAESDGVILLSATTGDGIYVWGGQVEIHPTKRAYLSTGASAYHGPRYDYDPFTLAHRGLLVEGPTGNWIKRSECLNTAVWSVVGSTVTPNVSAVRSLDGFFNADGLFEDANNTEHRITQEVSGLTSSQTYCFSVHLRPVGGRAWFHLGITSKDGNTRRAWFNANTGLFGTVQSGVTSTVIGYQNGWWRVGVAADALTGATTPKVIVGTASVDNTLTHTGSTGGGCYLWGAQLETGERPTSYIFVGSATASRGADSARLSVANVSNWHTAQGTLVIAAELFNQAANNAINGLGALWDGTTSNVVELTRATATNPLLANVVAGGSTVFASGALVTPTRNTIVKLGVGWEANSFKACADGSAVAADSAGAVPTGITHLLIGQDSAARYLNGWVREVHYTNARMVAADLQAATAHGDVDPAAFGAVFDGVTEDTTAIQAAINSLTANQTLDGRQRLYRVRIAHLKTQMVLQNFRFWSTGTNTELSSVVNLGTSGASTTHSGVTVARVFVNGNRQNHGGTLTTEDGGRHAFRLVGHVKDVLLTSVAGVNCATDGIALYSGAGNGSAPNRRLLERITVNDGRFNWNRRLGGSGDNMRDCTFRDCTFNYNGLDVPGTAGGATSTNPKQGFDLESYDAVTGNDSCTWASCTFRFNASSGFVGYQPTDPTTANFSPTRKLSWSNCYFDGGSASLAGCEITSSISAQSSAVRVYIDLDFSGCHQLAYYGFRNCQDVRIGGNGSLPNGSDAGFMVTVKSASCQQTPSLGGKTFSIDGATTVNYY